MLLLLRQRIFQIKGIDSELVRHHHISVVRHSPGDPVMAADGLQPPDLVFIGKSNTVHLVGTVFLQQASQTCDTLSGTVNVRKHQRHNVLLADAAGYLFHTILRRNIFHQWIRSQNSGIGSDGLCGRHAHTCRIDTVRCPDTLSVQCIGDCGITHGILRQIDLHMGKHGFVFFRLFFLMHHNEFLRCELPRRRIVIPGDHGGTVIRCLFSY